MSQSSPLVSILLVEGHEIARRGLQAMLEAIPFVHLVASAELMARVPDILTRETVDVLIVPSDFDPDEVADSVGGSKHRIRIVVLLRQADPDRLEQWARLGCDGVVLESTLTLHGLARTVLDAVGGEVVPLPTELARLVLRGAQPAEKGGHPLLTARETEVLNLLGEGLTNKEIAQRLGISDHSAKRYVGNILAKLNSPNRTSAVLQAIKENLLHGAET